MQINVAVVLDEGEEFLMDPSDAARAIIEVIDGVHADRDHCAIVVQYHTRGEHGYVPPPAPPPEEVIE